MLGWPRRRTHLTAGATTPRCTTSSTCEIATLSRFIGCRLANPKAHDHFCRNDFYTQRGLQTTCYNATDLWDTDHPATDLVGTQYEEWLFRDRMLHIVDAHDAARPLMLFYTPHVAHLPLQVPPSYLEKFAALTKGTDETLCSGFQAPTRPPVTGYVNPEASPWSCRAQYHAAVNLLDDNIGDVVAAMRKRGMWDRTLMVFSSVRSGWFLRPEARS